MTANLDKKHQFEPPIPASLTLKQRDHSLSIQHTPMAPSPSNPILMCANVSTSAVCGPATECVSSQRFHPIKRILKMPCLGHDLSPTVGQNDVHPTHSHDESQIIIVQSIESSIIQTQLMHNPTSCHFKSRSTLLFQHDFFP
jgi:hypothetical protein